MKALDDLEKVNTEHKVIVAAIHCSDKMQLTNQFPFFPFYQQMKKKIENETITDSYSIPFAIINRKATWGYPPSKNLEQPLGLVQKSSTVGIKLESVLGETTGTVQFTLAFSEDYKDLKYVVYILEDDVIDTQVGFTGNYNHKDVVRATVDSFKGVAIPSDKTAKNATFVSETFALTYKKANVDNLKVVVAVLNENDDVINAQQAKGNTAKDFVVISE